MQERLLMVPGPTNLSKSVLEVMSKPQVGHTDPDFVANFSETLKLARKAFRNDRGYQFVFTGTGTVGMEAAVASTVEPGDRALVLDTGTTVCNPIGEIVREARNAGVLAIVDGVCSVGGVELDFDRLGADLAFTGSQKALAAPPGAVLVAVSKEFLAQLEAKKERI